MGVGTSEEYEAAIAAEERGEWRVAATLWRRLWMSGRVYGEEATMDVLGHLDACLAEYKAQVDPTHGCSGEHCRTVGCTRRSEVQIGRRAGYPDYH